MRKLYSIILSAVLALPVAAQQPQIPNGGFEDGWGECTPWTSGNNAKTKGTTPGSWTISQVIGINTLGATIVGEEAEGYESEKAVKIYNSPNSIASSQTVPGYVTLGTTWSTAKGLAASNKDGGTFGGVTFTGRPVRITFMYKFEKSTENDQPANAIAYLWKGTYTQAAVPAEISLSTPKTVDMVNRDRSILGITAPEGGEITTSDDAELIAKGTTVITEVTSEWTKGEIVLEYLSDATPEMLNIIFAANDYFNSEGIAKGNMLIVDNVEAEYPRELEKEDVYKGSVDISLAGGDPVTEDANVHIKSYTDGSCDFELPNFSFAGESLGTIKVPNVAVDKSNAEKFSYTGSAKNLALQMNGSPIIADADLTGTTDNSGNAEFTIPVVWHGGALGDIPIAVKFTGKLESTGIDNVEAVDVDAPVEYYNLQGVRVADPTPGLYIRRQGSKVSKVIVR